MLDIILFFQQKYSQVFIMPSCFFIALQNKAIVALLASMEITSSNWISLQLILLIIKRQIIENVFICII